ncbi:hypothetical protein E2C01_102434 [Portunus trituberculatus]|uniref:Uncharacterized protein n=1 Tax=Portunus trituberculatus TaxID=210409 RepID=A0A5B7KD56_PORTR|nr:hypothetical protein [Portunus trituberculatus]
MPWSPWLDTSRKGRSTESPSWTRCTGAGLSWRCGTMSTASRASPDCRCVTLILQVCDENSSCSGGKPHPSLGFLWSTRRRWISKDHEGWSCFASVPVLDVCCDG